MPPCLLRLIQPLLIVNLLTGLSLPASANAETLHLLNWRTYTELSILERFTATTGIEVELTLINSNEELRQQLLDNPGQFDVAVASDSWVRILADEGLLLPFDATQLDSFILIDEVWIGPYFDPQQLYSVPLHWGTTSFAVNTDLVSPTPNDLSIVFEPPEALRGKIGMLRDSRDVIELALKYLELPACTADPEHLQQLETLLVKQREYLFSYEIQGMVNRLASGEIAVQMIYNGAAMRSRLINPAVEYIFPVEGVTVWTDNFVIPATSSQPELAQQFIDFFLRPEHIAAQSNMTRYGNVIGASREFIDAELRVAPELMVPPGTRITYQETCSPQVMEQYLALWQRLITEAN